MDDIMAFLVFLMEEVTFSYINYKCKSFHLSSGVEQEEVILTIYPPCSYEGVFGRLPYNMTNGEEQGPTTPAPAAGTTRYRNNLDIRSLIEERDKDRDEKIMSDIRNEIDISFEQLCMRLLYEPREPFHSCSTLLIDVGHGRCEALNQLSEEEWELFCTAVALSLPKLERLELRSMMEQQQQLQQGVVVDFINASIPREVLNDERLSRLLQAVPATLKHLHLTDISDYQLSFQQLSRFRHLETLILERSYWAEVDDHEEQPQSLSSSVQGVQPATWNILADVLPTFPCLQNVLLQGLVIINMDIRQWTILKACERIPNLQNIQIYDCFLREQQQQDVRPREDEQQSPELVIVKSMSIPPSIQSHLEYRPRLNSAGLFELIPKHDKNGMMEEWIHVLESVCDRVDCLYAVLTTMDPNVFCTAALQSNNNNDDDDNKNTNTNRTIP